MKIDVLEIVRLVQVVLRCSLTNTKNTKISVSTCCKYSDLLNFNFNTFLRNSVLTIQRVEKNLHTYIPRESRDKRSFSKIVSFGFSKHKSGYSLITNLIFLSLFISIIYQLLHQQDTLKLAICTFRLLQFNQTLYLIQSIQIDIVL